MDPRLLTFITVAEKKSFSLAAKQLHLTQPAVTMQIHALEEYYKLRLFNRNKNEVGLAPGGQVLYKYAKEIVQLYNIANSELSNLSEAVCGTLVVGASHTACEYIVPRLITPFKTIFQGIDVAVYSGNNRHIVQAVCNGDVDIGIIAGHCDNKRMIVEKLFTDDLILVVARNNQWVGRNMISLQELAAERLVLREPGSATTELIEKSFRDAGFTLNSLNILAQLSSHDAIKQIVEANLGVSIISRLVVSKELKSGALVAINIFGLNIIRDFNLVCPGGAVYSRQVKEFIQFCKQHRDSLLAS